MLLAACEQFLDKTEAEIQHIALVTLEGHQRAIMGSMTVEVSPTYSSPTQGRAASVSVLSLKPISVTICPFSVNFITILKTLLCFIR